MTGMEDFFRMMASKAAEAESAPRRPALIVEALRDAAAPYLAGAHSFKEGDLVTPRAGTDVNGAGEPHIVIGVREGADFEFVGEPSSNCFGIRPDLRVLFWNHGTYFPHWVEGAKFETWVEKAEEVPARPRPASRRRPDVDAASILARLRERVEAAGSARAFATHAGLSHAYVLDCLHQRRQPGPRLLTALGVERRVVFVERE